eukprot:7282337-Ditylum_brightwellii.AAC.1
MGKTWSFRSRAMKVWAWQSMRPRTEEMNGQPRMVVTETDSPRAMRMEVELPSEWVKGRW